MHGRWPTELMKTLLTPRKIAWIVAFAGIVYFIYISPKTPVEFFDASVSDQAGIRELEVERNKWTDPARAAASRKMDELMSCSHRMDRIALQYDLTNNPQRVNLARSTIVEGFYSTDEHRQRILRHLVASRRRPAMGDDGQSHL